MGTGSGKVVLPIEGEQLAIAVSMDFMNAAKRVLLSAAGTERAQMVAKAISGDFEEFECPAGLVNAADTTWFVDTDSFILFDELADEYEEFEVVEWGAEE